MSAIAAYFARHRNAAGFVALLAALAYLLSGALRPIDPYDEGIPLYGAWRTWHGEVPYRDFWTLYGPAQFYTLAGVFDIFGGNVAAARVWDCLVKATLVALLYMLSRRNAGRGAALATGVLAALWLERAGRFNYTVYPALAAAFASLIVFDSAASGKQRFRAAMCGVCAALAALYRLDFGIYAAIALAVAHVAGRRGPRWSLFGLAITAIPAALLLSIAVPTAVLYEQLIHFPLEIFPKVRGVPFPGIADLYARPAEMFIMAAPVLLLLASLAEFRSASKNMGAALAAGLAALNLVLINQLVVRPDFSHALPLFLAVLPFAAGIAERAFTESSPSAALRRGFLSLLALPLIGLPLQAKWAAVRSDDPGAAPTYTASPAQGLALEWLAEHTAPTESIFIGLPRHDVLMRNDIALYFLAQRRAAGPYHELHPGAADSDAAQREIIEALERNGTRVVVSAVPYPFELLHFTQPSSALLDVYLREHFTQSAEFGYYKIFTRKESHQP